MWLDDPRLPLARCEAVMKHTVKIARLLLSLFGIALLVLGILFWMGYALSLLQLHMLLGGLFVLCLWVLAALGLAAPGARPLALLVLVWSLIVPALGVSQVQWLPGSDHWVIQAAHLLVGLIAIGLGHALSRRIGRRPAVTVAVPGKAT